jgi:hypothetical protein
MFKDVVGRLLTLNEDLHGPEFGLLSGLFSIDRKRTTICSSQLNGLL